MRRARSAAWVVLLLLLPALGVATSAVAATEESRYLVGYDPGDADAAETFVQASGGTIEKNDRAMGLMAVRTSNADRLERGVALHASMRWTERNDPIAMAGAQWNGAQWNGAQWNGAQWNGAQWNGAQWNGAQWNGAQWNGAQWNGASGDGASGDGAQWNAAHWSVKSFNAAGGTKWQYHIETTDPGLVWQWGHWRTRTTDAWSVSSGTQSTTLCVLDSGVAWDHPDLAPNMWVGPNGERGFNAITPGASAYDDAGHGTHIAGIAAAAIGDGFGVAGVGNTLIMPVKVLDQNGRGLEGDLAFGIAWCAKNGADVAVMALSATQPGPSMDLALDFAVASDMLLLASAGNAGACTDCVAYPASDTRVMAVSAIGGDMRLAAFSSQGRQVELTAPGVHILGPLPGDAFAFGSGTSQAVAYAAGAAALLRDVRPDLTADQARTHLQATARDIGAAGVDDIYGHGLVDVGTALGLAPPKK